MVDRVFLGGTMNTPWRDKIIRDITIEYFNPTVDVWTDQHKEVEKQEKVKCNIHLYVLTSNMDGYFSIAEVVDSSNQDKITLLYIIPDGFTPHQLSSLESVMDMVKTNGGFVLTGNDLTKVSEILNNISNTVALLSANPIID